MACLQDNVLVEAGVSIDRFRYDSHIRIIVLSHAHQDHFVGFRKTGVKHFHVVCTSMTYALLPEPIRTHKYLKWHRVDYGETWSFNDITIRLFVAHHCPGSAMIDVRVPNAMITCPTDEGRGTVSNEKCYTRLLYTGDFRYDAYRFGAFFHYVERNRIQYDRVYVDDYFAECNVNMPTYDDSAQLLLTTLLHSTKQTCVERFPKESDEMDPCVFPFRLNVSVMGIEMLMNTVRSLLKQETGRELCFVYDAKSMRSKARQWRFHQLVTLLGTTYIVSQHELLEALHHHRHDKKSKKRKDGKRKGSTQERWVYSERQWYLPIGFRPRLPSRKANASTSTKHEAITTLPEQWIICSCSSFLMVSKSVEPTVSGPEPVRLPFCTHSNKTEIQRFLDRFQELPHVMACNQRWQEVPKQ